MARKNRFVKFTIIFILAFFVLVTGLSMIVPYIGGNKNIQGTGDVDTGAIVESGLVDTTIDSGAALPEMTKEEASKKIQEAFSGVDTSKVLQ